MLVPIAFVLLLSGYGQCVPVSNTRTEPIFVPKNLTTVKELNAEKYIGRWYQVSML